MFEDNVMSTTVSSQELQLECSMPVQSLDYCAHSLQVIRKSIHEDVYKLRRVTINHKVRCIISELQATCRSVSRLLNKQQKRHALHAKARRSVEANRTKLRQVSTVWTSCEQCTNEVSDEQTQVNSESNASESCYVDLCQVLASESRIQQFCHDAATGSDHDFERAIEVIKKATQHKQLMLLRSTIGGRDEIRP